MLIKRKKFTPQEYIQFGMAFFLLSIFVSTVADGRMVGALIARVISSQWSVEGLQGFAAGLSIPFSVVSIYFNLRGLIAYRSGH